MGLPRMLVSVSGGKTSMRMLYEFETRWKGQYETLYVFANTGEEWEATLEFVRDCEQAWGVKIHWVEAVVNPLAGKGIRHKAVSFETAARNGEPYEAVIKKYGIPCKGSPHCTRDLKSRPILSFARDYGFTDYDLALGMRIDEQARLTRTHRRVYPFADWLALEKLDIDAWWERQTFNLRLEPHQGNCKWCWKKSTAKLIKIATETPKVFDFPSRMEAMYARPGLTHFFRGYVPARKFVESAFMLEMFPTAERLSGCEESCEPFGDEEVNG